MELLGVGITHALLGDSREHSLGHGRAYRAPREARRTGNTLSRVSTVEPSLLQGLLGILLLAVELEIALGVHSWVSFLLDSSSRKALAFVRPAASYQRNSFDKSLFFSRAVITAS